MNIYFEIGPNLLHFFTGLGMLVLIVFILYIVYKSFF